MPLKSPPSWHLWDGIYAILGISVLLESEAGTEPMTLYSNARRSEVRQSSRPALLAEVLSQWVSCKHTQKTCHGGGGDLVAKSCPTLATPWIIAHQTPLSIGLSRQEYLRGLPFPSPGDLPDPGTDPGSLTLQVYAILLLKYLWLPIVKATGLNVLFLKIFIQLFIFDVDHLKNLYWICYTVSSVFACFGFLVKRHVGS